MRQCLFALAPMLFGACHNSGGSSVADGGPAASVGDSSDSSVAAKTPAAPRDRSVMIARGLVHQPHEVELDPRGEVALTIDKLGHLRLWPAIRSGDAAQSSPWVLPLEEPIWMSVAQAEDGFVVALIDTANAGQVYAVTPNEDGRAARLSPLFSLAPDDPLLELHALDGGERFLALGVDHRVRLYDRAGALLSVVDERSFGPWQLRVVHAEPGQPPKIAAVLAQPLRVQAIELRDDRLEPRGEARTVVLDRGPNHNDLALSPDGKTVAALRRRSGRGRDFSIELIDLETGDRRLVAGQSDTTIRPRMHFAEPERILLETGSYAGKGLWLELGKAEALADPADADPDSKLAKRLVKTRHDSIPLVASAEIKPEFFEPDFDPPWDHGDRLHASVVAGVRVNIERSGRKTRLIVDPLASDRHFVLGGSPPPGVLRALDRSGAHVAVDDSDGKVWIEAVGTGERVGAEVEHKLGNLVLVAFVNDRALVLLDDKGKLALADWQAGRVLESTKLDAAWGVHAAAYHDAPGGGVLGWREGRSSEVRLLGLANAALGEVRPLPRAERTSWLDVLAIGDAEAGALFGMTESDADERVDEYTSSPDGLLFFTEKHPRTPLVVRDDGSSRSLRLPAGQGRELAASPDGGKVAIVQFRERDDGTQDDHLLSVYDVASGERLWTLGDPGHLGVPKWSGDGKRLLIEREVHDAQTGELLSRHLEATPVIEDRADADFARKSQD